MPNPYERSWSAQDLEAAAWRVAETGVLDAAGVRLSADELESLLDAAPRDGGDAGRPVLRRVELRGATITGPLSFDSVTIAGEADFADATFGAEASFVGSRFQHARFSRATFHGFADFGRTAFHVCDFAGAHFQASVSFSQAVVALDAHFRYVASHGNVDFSAARFEGARRLGPVLANGAAFDEAIFSKPVRIELGARRASFARAVFRAGADLRLRWADVLLEGAEFAAPSLVASLSASATAMAGSDFLGWEEPVDDDAWRRRETPPPAFAPRVVSLRGANVAQLTLSRVDLRACRFAGAHGLDALRLEQVQLAQPPAGWRTRRQTIAEEHRWRVARHPDRGWYEGRVRAPAEIERTSEALDPLQIAGIYRALRKRREDDKDEPGAADFYYGEMEMRRQRSAGVRREAQAGLRTVAAAERALLRLYWLISGYGLRASRALAALALAVALLALPLDLWGFRPDRAYGRALLFAAESSIGLLRPPEARLSAGGEVVQIVLRLAGPLLFGLAALAVRSRVKR